MLQTMSLPKSGRTIPFVSDYMDFCIYIDANAKHIEQWYVKRFERLRETAFRDPAAYFHKYAHLDDDEIVTTAEEIWREINLKNLEENILPTRQRAHLILRKAKSHAVEKVMLRKL